MNAKEYYKSSIDKIENINTKFELDVFVKDFVIQNRDYKYYQKLKDKKLSEQLFLIIRDKVLTLIIEKGDIFDKSYLALYEFFKDVKVDSIEKLNSHSKFFKQHYETLEDKNVEKYMIGNLIFGFDIFDGNFENGLKDLFIRMVKPHAYLAHKSEEYKFTLELLKEFTIDDDFVIDTILELISIETLSKLDDIARRSVFLHTLMWVWNLECMFNNKKWLKLFEPLVEVLNYFIEQNDIKTQMYIHFFAYHIHTQEEWKIFNEKVDRPASIFYERYAKKNNLVECKKKVRKDGKKKIALICDRMTNNSPHKVMISLLEDLSKSQDFLDNYDLTVYSLSYIDKCYDNEVCINDVLKLGFKFHSCIDKFREQGFYYNHLKKANMIRNDIIAHDIDILITQVSGYDINTFLLSTRSAPKQIFWSHGNYEFDVIGIDKKISHYHGNDCFEQFSINFNIENKYNPYIEPSSIFFERSKFPKDKFILGCIGRLMKLNSDEYLETVAQIMNKCPNTIYIACGVGNKDELQVKLKKLGILDRWYFTGQIEPHLYGNIIQLFLAPFPLGSGEALEEYRNKGRSYVALHSIEWFEGIKENFEDDFILNSLYSSQDKDNFDKRLPIIPENKFAFHFAGVSNVINKEDYLRTAVKLISDEKLRNKQIQERKYIVQNTPVDINEFLEKI
jgi:hypothetical protein